MFTYLQQRHIYTISKVTATFSNFTVCFFVVVTGYFASDDVRDQHNENVI